ncbi:hypothetical protein HK105_200215 [Polyrhizophydium stewartii]|uniref:MARVEL domain-containing protein n=1 Tax=Polyrhizophydium stewartii TaxID=2732419 RepID=A0ABR4NL44_9FUNG
MVPLLFVQFVLALVNLISNSVFTFGLWDQAQYGLGGICLLFIENYHKDTTLNSFVFSAYSGSCSSAVSFGLFSFVAIAAIAGARFLFLRKRQEPSTRVIFAFALVASFMAFLFLIMASIVTAGLNQTCSGIESADTRSCGAVFHDGFFAGDTNKLYPKNLNTVRAAVGAGWMVLISWGAIAGIEWYSYRQTSNKWW